MKRFVSVLLIFALVFVTGIASLSAHGTDEPVVSSANNEFDKKNAARFETVLNNNYAFANDFSSVSTLIKLSSISLLPHAKNGELENNLIIDFMKNMYGVDPSTLCDEGEELLVANGTTALIPMGFTKYNHVVENVHLNEDGTYTVYSTVSALDGENEVFFDAISRFVETNDSSFGYILVSCELLLPEEAPAQI